MTASDPTRTGAAHGWPPAGDGSTNPAVADAVARAFRDEWGQVVATLIGLTGDFDLAEECTQDAFEAALRRWPRGGVPRRPGAWLTTAARNRAVDRLRREHNGAAKLAAAPRRGVPARPSTTTPRPAGCGTTGSA